MESERRIRSIAIVHETLSRDAGDVVVSARSSGRSPALVEETSSSPDLAIHFVVDGERGKLPGEVATPLAVVLNELMQNAVDHTFVNGAAEGKVNVVLDAATHEQVDDGSARRRRGPARPTSRSTRRTGLGLTIVQALVTGELGGSIEMHSEQRKRGLGHEVHVKVPVSAPRVEVCGVGVSS